jgi:hypothetical protein
MKVLSFIKKRESVLPLMIMAVLFFGVFDAGTTIYTVHVMQSWGIVNPYDYEISPLIMSGLFGTGDISVILTKIVVITLCLVILFIALSDTRLVMSVNLMLMGSIVAGLLAGVSNLIVAFTGENLHVFAVSSAIITLMVASSFWIYALVAACRHPKTIKV